MRALILPGMDGSGALLREFREALAPEVVADVVAYPPELDGGYDALVAQARARLPADAPFVLVGESFSGPVAIRLAASAPPGLAALVLCATFAASPRPSLRPLRGVLRLPLPKPPTRWLMAAMMGRWTTPEWTQREREALRAMPARVARRRLAAVLDVDAGDALAEVRCPVLYLQASHDRLVSPHCWERIARVRPEAQRVVLEGPHFLLQHQAPAAARAVKRFLAPVRPVRHADGMLAAGGPSRWT